MELSNEFVVPVAVDEAWVLLTDVERIAPCMPGAELQEIEGDAVFALAGADLDLPRTRLLAVLEEVPPC